MHRIKLLHYLLFTLLIGLTLPNQAVAQRTIVLTANQNSAAIGLDRKDFGGGLIVKVITTTLTSEVLSVLVSVLSRLP